MKTLAVGALLLVLLIPSAFAGSQRTHAGKVLCVELRGNKETRPRRQVPKHEQVQTRVSRKSRFRVA